MGHGKYLSNIKHGKYLKYMKHGKYPSGITYDKLLPNIKNGKYLVTSNMANICQAFNIINVSLLNTRYSGPNDVR